MIAVVLALVLEVVAAPAGTPRGIEKVSLAHDGRMRSYAVYVGRTAPRAGAPLLVALHGRGGSGTQLRLSTRLDEEADRRGFVVVYPEGIDRGWRDLRQATLRRAPAGGPDDVGFVLRVIDAVAASHAVDPSRVYLAGHSNGGFLAITLACAHAERIRGIAVVAASLPVAPCAPSRPVSAVFFHGTADGLVPFGGGVVGPGGARGFVRAAEETVAFFAARAGCAETEEEPARDIDRADGTRVRTIDHRACAAPVRHFIVDGGGHGWPGARGRSLPNATRELDATREIGAFFFATSSDASP